MVAGYALAAALLALSLALASWRRVSGGVGWVGGDSWRLADDVAAIEWRTMLSVDVKIEHHDQQSTAL